MKHHIGVSSPFQSYLLLSRIFCTMNKLHTLIYSVLIFTCLSCQQQTPQTQIEQTAIDFCEAFYNFNYPVAKEWSTPSSQSYLSFLASNVGQTHLEQLKTRGAAKVSVISSEIDANLEEASVVCQIKMHSSFIPSEENGIRKFPARYARISKSK